MTVPDRVEAVRLLYSLDPTPRFARHARAVAEVAGWLAARAASQGVTVDRRLAEAAALLHDTDKALPPDHPLRALPHGDGSAAWLEACGHTELGPLVAGHSVTRMADATAYRRWERTASLEARIVAYADKRAEQRLVSMDQRFASWQRRYPPDPGQGRTARWQGAELSAIRRRAAALETEVCEAAGTTPEAVGRLHWTGPAIRAARTVSPEPRRGSRA